MKEFGVSGFLSYIKLEKSYSTHTIKSYQGDLRDFFDYCTQKMSLDHLGAISHFHIRSWLADLATKKLEHTSINRKISCLKSYFKYLKSKALIANNPMKKIVSPKNKKSLPKFITVEDLDKVLNNIDETNEGVYQTELGNFAVRLLYETGMRSNELLQLTVQDINFARQTIKVIGKGSKQRIIPISFELINEIKRFLEIRSKLEIINSDRLILTLKGNEPYAKMLYNLINKELKDKVRSDKKSPHVLRHSFATHLADNGAEIKAIQDLLGHSSLSATQIYTHNSIQKLQEAYQRAHPRANK